MADDQRKSLYSDRSDPSRQRRRRRRSSSQHPPPGPGDMRGRKRQKSRRKDQQGAESPWSRRLVWIGLTVVLLGYVGLLGLTTLQKWKKSRAAAVAASIPEPVSEEVVAPEGSWVAATDLRTELQNWERNQRDFRDIQRFVDDPDRAAEVESRLNRALELTPNHLGLKVELADNLLTQERYQDSADLAFTVLQADPDNLDAGIILAKALAGGDQHEATLVLAHWLIKKDPISMLGHRLAMEAYLAQGETGKAIEHINRVLTLDSDNFSLLNKLAGAYSDLGQHDRAIAVLKRAAGDDQNSAAALFSLARNYAAMKDTEHALETLDQASEELGLSFVATWLQSKEFDAIRDTPEFQEFRSLAERLLTPTTDAEETEEESNPKQPTG